MHCKVSQLYSYEVLYITYVYGFNKNILRRPLWKPWCTFLRIYKKHGVLSVMNAILGPHIKIVGEEVAYREISKFKNYIEVYEFEELINSRAQFSWSSRNE